MYKKKPPNQVHANLFAKAKIFAVIFRETAAATRLRLVFSLDATLRAFSLARVNSLFPQSAPAQIGAEKA